VAPPQTPLEELTTLSRPCGDTETSTTIPSLKKINFLYRHCGTKSELHKTRRYFVENRNENTTKQALLWRSHAAYGSLAMKFNTKHVVCQTNWVGGCVLIFGMDAPGRLKTLDGPIIIEEGAKYAFSILPISKETGSTSVFSAS